MKRALVWFVRRYWPFLPTALTVWGAWLLFRDRDFSSNRDDVAQFALDGIGVAFLFAVGIMLVRLKRWTWRALGQVCTYTGDAFLYGGTGALTRPLTLREIDLILALLATGSVLLVFGLLYWIKETIDERHEALAAAEAARRELEGWPKA